MLAFFVYNAAMSFDATVYQVLIASPSDVADERIIATEAVNEWNVQHAKAEKTVLLPVKWETHSVPTTGEHPQEIIMRQLVDDADLAIVIFWTKLGTRTPKAASGTVQELDSFVATNRPAMIYFSSVPIDPNKIDHRQLRLLKKYKSEKFKTALVGDFKTGEELKAKLLNHLTQKVRELRASGRTSKQHVIEIDEETDREATAAGIEARQQYEQEQQDLLRPRAQQERDAFEAKLLEGKFRSFWAARGILAISIIPAKPLKKPISFRPSEEQTLRRIIIPMRCDDGSFEPFGRSVYSAYPPPSDYPLAARQSPQAATELTDTGSIYAADNWRYLDSDLDFQPPKYRMSVFQPNLIKAVERYLTGLRRLGVSGVLFVGISWLNQGPFKLAPDDEYEYYHDGLGRGSSGDDIITQTIDVQANENLFSFESVTEILHPALWHFWREAGFHNVPVYEENGKIKKT